MNRNIFAVAWLPVWFALFAGFGSISLIPTAAQAATLTQNFEFVVDRIAPTNFPLSELPPIGTRGQGSFTIDTDQIRFGQFQPFYDPTHVAYFVEQPTSLLIDFFGKRYTNLPVSIVFPRTGPYFTFTRAETGGYRVSNFAFAATDPGNPPISIESSGFRYQIDVYGPVSFTPAEAIPEPTTIAGVPIAIAVAWTCHRRLKRRSRIH